MIEDRYDFRISLEGFVYEFASEGFKARINKLIIYSETEVKDVYNLAFGDKNDDTGEIDDEVVSNNGDTKRVLNTVASTVSDFFSKIPNASIYIVGSTPSRTRLYRISISNNIEEIEEDFEVYGQTGYKWVKFEKGINCAAFLIRRKKSKFNI
ncbi:MAG TPA: hypothetical protein VF623_09545 [Segetibacter sp.]|jgi:hypothetical protein